MPIKIFFSPPFFFSYFLTVHSFLEFYLFLLSFLSLFISLSFSFSFELFIFFELANVCLYCFFLAARFSPTTNLCLQLYQLLHSLGCTPVLSSGFCASHCINSFIPLGAHQCCLLALWVAMWRINNLALLSSWPDVHSIDIQTIFFIDTMSTALVK